MIDREMGIPLLDKDSDYKLMLYYVHDCGILSSIKLWALGIRSVTINKHYANERSKYRYHAIPLSKKPLRILHGRKPKYLIPRHHDTTQSREILDCRQSVIQFYLHRDESHQDEPG